MDPFTLVTEVTAIFAVPLPAVHRVFPHAAARIFGKTMEIACTGEQVAYIGIITFRKRGMALAQNSSSMAP